MSQVTGPCAHWFLANPVTEKDSTTTLPGPRKRLPTRATAHRCTALYRFTHRCTSSLHTPGGRSRARCVVCLCVCSNSVSAVPVPHVSRRVAPARGREVGVGGKAAAPPHPLSWESLVCLAVSQASVSLSVRRRVSAGSLAARWHRAARGGARPAQGQGA